MGGGDGYVPLFETKEPTGRIAYKMYAISVWIGVFFVWVYRATRFPEGEGKWVWLGMLGAEIWFGFYWIFVQSVRWKPVQRLTFKERLSRSCVISCFTALVMRLPSRGGRLILIWIISPVASVLILSSQLLLNRNEKVLPGVDIFVCTADPVIEPPLLVINTVLSVMAYDYPPEKLSVYLSDDAGSDVTFYALLQASHFSAYWLPFCRKFNVGPRSPEVYFSSTSGSLDNAQQSHEWLFVKNMYEEMKSRVEMAMKLGVITEDIKTEHEGFSEWNSYISSNDHPTFLQILSDGRKAVDVEGSLLPLLVYLAREKRPQEHHHFKAGALNALIRVSSEISDGLIILNVDCDMYSNNSEAMKDAVCFFLDEEKGHEIAFVQFAQNFMDNTKNDIYASNLKLANEVENLGLDGYGGQPYFGSGCFHRRESLCGRHYSQEFKREWKSKIETEVDRRTCKFEKAKAVAGSTYEEGSQWGKEIGLKYGCPSEDLITGLSIQCRGWKSTYCNPKRKAFLGVCPKTLEQALVQHKRWAEGMLQIFTSRYCPLIYGHGKIKLGLQLSYCSYTLWALTSFPTLYYVVFPSLCLFKGISVFPKISCLWSIPFIYVFVANNLCSLGDSFSVGHTIKGWWNMQRMWILRRTSSYVISTIDTALKLLGLAESGFAITAKVADEEVLRRYDQEIMEFGPTSPLFAIISTNAIVNFICLVGAIKRVAMNEEMVNVEALILQFVLCGLLVMINIPIYQALFLRKDNGRIPQSIAFVSTSLATMACLAPIY